MREEFEREFDPVQAALGEFLYWMQFAESRNKTYEKILIPLDGSVKSAEGVLGVVQRILDPEGVAILLHVIPPSDTKMVGPRFMSGSQVEKHARSKAMGHLKYFADRQSEGPGRWRCEVTVSASVANGIADFARREEVDLIAMYTHGRAGLAKLIKGSIAEKVQGCASTEVRVVTPREVVAR